MNELELEKYCDNHKHCDCKCVKCPAFAAYQRSELGMDDYDYDDNE